ncbi:hypothetical protein [Teredinibacter purpureus]|uniref:hypothetical protein n=1 Tax=Teredinibacter purpureus TaxID=2731756 RepID=UPI0013C466FE|nr:hypothetical protein [Teredinibacter purpureus]
MKKEFFTLLALLFLSSYANAIGWAHECEEHSNSIVLTDAGYPHLYTVIRLNHTTTIKEVQIDRWFVHEVECTKDGFTLNILKKNREESTKEKHKIKVLSATEYEFI